MDRNRHAIAPGAIIENVGEDVVVMLPSTVEAIRLSGETARTLRDIQAGTACGDGGPVDDLVALGIVKDSSALSRRSLITAGAFGAAAGISVLAMPTVAMASSTGRLVITEAAWGWYNYSCDPGVEVWGRQFWVYFDGGKNSPPPSGGLTVSDGIGFQPNLLQYTAPAEGELWFGFDFPPDATNIPKSTPLDGDLQGSFNFDGEDYELPFTFEITHEDAPGC